jgi:DNA-binding CsgD family transcriptional regulator
LAERRALFTLAELELLRGYPTRALELAASLQPAANDGSDLPIAAVCLLQAEALAVSGRPAEARSALREARALALAHGPRGLQWRCSAALAQLAERTGGLAEAMRDEARRELRDCVERLDEEHLRRALLADPAAQSLLAAAPTRDPAGLLTRREREIASQVATGKTNRQIAGDLYLSEKTVEMHVGNCFAKLGFQSRAQLAAWAVAQHLAPAPHQGPDA